VVEGFVEDADRRDPFLRLSSNDKVYSDIRNANIVSVGRLLQQRSIRVGEMEAMKPDEKTSSVQDIQDFLTKVRTDNNKSTRVREYSLGAGGGTIVV
jgi:hypothetical protein